MMDNNYTVSRFIVELILEQRRYAGNNFFEYSFSFCEKKYKETNDERFLIHPTTQRSILKELAKEGIIEISYVEEKEIGDNTVKYEWVNPYEWMMEYSAGDDPIAFYPKIYINIEPENIITIKQHYDLIEHNAKLIIENEEVSIVFDNDSYMLTRLRSGVNTTKILLYAYKHPDQTFTRRDLVSSGVINSPVSGKLTSLRSIFKSSPIFSLTSFVNITSDSIRVTPEPNNLTRDELGFVSKYINHK